MPTRPLTRWLSALPDNTRAQLALLLIGVCATYLWTLDVPFYLDDFHAIAENPALHDLSNLGQLWQFSPARFVGHLTLALNYDSGAEQVAGYHWVNITIHLLAGVALWALLKALLLSPALADSAYTGLRWLPLLAALLFLLHPLQTQGVTYIIQRLASLTGMFYLAALAYYAWGRVSRRVWPFLAVAVLGALALLTKQNAATLPGALLLLELLFFHRFGLTGRAVILALGAAGMALLAWLVNQPFLMHHTLETQDFTRLQYFATQMKVLWHYIGSFFVPIDQRIEFAIPLAAEGLRTPGVPTALLGHAAALLAAFALWSRAPLVAFGVLFYYLAHLVESSFLPISDLAFEHRTYLPNAGLAIACMAVLTQWDSRSRLRHALPALACLLLLGAGWLTYQRNQLWRDPIALLTEDTRLSPNKERAWTSLAKELMRRGRFKEALPALGTALNLSRREDGLEVRPATLLNAVIALHYTDQHKKAFNLARILPVGVLAPVDKSRFHEVRGMALIKLQREDLARKELTAARQAFHNPNAIAGLAYLDLRANDLKAAEEQAMEVLRENPGNPMARQVMATIQKIEQQGPSLESLRGEAAKPRG